MFMHNKKLQYIVQVGDPNPVSGSFKEIEIASA